MLDENKVASKQVWSANLFYLISGIVSIVLIAAVEIAAVINIVINKNKPGAISCAAILQILVLLLLLFTTTIGDYVHRKQFLMYCCMLDSLSGTDIHDIKINYHVVDLNENYILYIDKKDFHNFNVWKLYQGYDDLNKFAKQMISNNTNHI